jgi:hypothetical protein
VFFHRHVYVILECLCTLQVSYEYVRPDVSVIDLFTDWSRITFPLGFQECLKRDVCALQTFLFFKHKFIAAQQNR